MTDALGGLLVVDKPAGWTSHDVVARVRRLAGTRRVGHAGTLDPMATGVLVLGIDRGTKLLTFLVGCDKSYAATIRLGQSTITDDAEGETSALLGVPDARALEAELPAAVAAPDGRHRAGAQLGERDQGRRRAQLRPGPRRRRRRAARPPGDGEPLRRARGAPGTDAGRGRAAGRRRRRRRGGRRLVGHLRAGPGPRPRRPPRGRWPPHGAAPHPGRPLRPRRRPTRSRSSPRRPSGGTRRHTPAAGGRGGAGAAARARGERRGGACASATASASAAAPSAPTPWRPSTRPGGSSPCSTRRPSAPAPRSSSPPAGAGA